MDLEYAPPDELGLIFARLSGVLLSEETVETSMHLIATLAARSLQGSLGAGVTLVSSAGLMTAQATSEAVKEVDDLQYSTQEGPCIDSIRLQETIRIDDLATDDRWPRWQEAMRRHHVTSTLSAPLTAGGVSLGALKVYSVHAGAFDVAAQDMLEMFAQQAAVLLMNKITFDRSERLTQSLQEALRSRDIIGQAKGILMAQRLVDEESAFSLLVAASQRTNVKVREVARQLVESMTTSRD